MKIYSFIFLMFLILGVSIYYILGKNYRKYFLLFLNYLFYFYFSIEFSLLLLAITSLNYFAGNMLINIKNEKTKKYIFTGAITLNILSLGIFKYFNFFIESFNTLFKTIGFGYELSTIAILAPLGISYYIFQTLTYLLDIQFGIIEKKYSFIDFQVFASFFPTIIAGPINRASAFLPQLETEKQFDLNTFKKSLALITIGVFRKLFIADPVGSVVSQIFAEPEYYKSVEIFSAVLLYPIQLYNDFAGYSSIARGVAKLFGLNIISNFKQPFLAISIADFWRRWHISFSFWLRDYLFTPLQLKFRNKGITGTIFAIILTFFICGLWHGPTWGNVLWGMIMGIYLSVSTVTASLRSSLAKKMEIPEAILNIFRRIFIFLIIVFSFLIARADSINIALDMIRYIFQFTPSELTSKFIIFSLTAFFASYLIDLFEVKFKSQAFLMKINPPLKYALYTTIWFFYILILLTQNKLPFIYEKF